MPRRSSGGKGDGTKTGFAPVNSQKEIHPYSQRLPSRFHNYDSRNKLRPQQQFLYQRIPQQARDFLPVRIRLA